MSSSDSQNGLDLALPGAADTRREARAWLAAMAKERRLSAKTVEAYGRDLRQFPAFLTGPLGEPPGVAGALSPNPPHHPARPPARARSWPFGRAMAAGPPASRRS